MLMHKYIQPELFHRFMVLCKGTGYQLDKLNEEVEELRDALVSGDVDRIKEEVADVEVCLPYLYLCFKSTKRQRVIEYKGGAEIMPYIETWLNLYKFHKNHQSEFLTVKILDIVTSLLCEALFEIYVKYDLDMYEITEIRQAKKQRTIRRLFNRDGNYDGICKSVE